jgi:hypothetical protein
MALFCRDIIKIPMITALVNGVIDLMANRMTVILQKPSGLPPSDRFDRVDFTQWGNVLFYILLPIAFLLFFRWWLKQKKKS